MELFELVAAQTVPDAVKAQARSSTAQNGADVRFIAGGTNLIDYMKLNVERPKQLVDINGLPLNRIEKTADGGLKIGALTGRRHVSRSNREGAVCSPVTCPAGRRVSAVTQHGDDRRKPATEDTLRLLPGHSNG